MLCFFEKHMHKMYSKLNGCYTTAEFIREIAPEIHDFKGDEETGVDENKIKNSTKELKSKTHSNKNLKKITPNKNLNDSFLLKAKELNIPVFVSGLGDGSLGDIFTFTENRKKMKIDNLKDFKYFVSMSNDCIGLVIGDGAIVNRMAMSEIKEFVHLTTRMSYDGSDFENNLIGKSLRVVGEANIVLPLLVYGAFED